MPCLTRPVLFSGKAGSKILTTLFNPGEGSLIRCDAAGKMSPLGLWESFISCSGNGGQLLSASDFVRLRFSVSGLLFNAAFRVVSSPATDVVIGADAIRRWQLLPDFENNRIEAYAKLPHLRPV